MSHKFEEVKQTKCEKCGAVIYHGEKHVCIVRFQGARQDCCPKCGAVLVRGEKHDCSK